MPRHLLASTSDGNDYVYCAINKPGDPSGFILHRRYAPRAALGLTLGGVPAVLVAAFIVKALPLSAVRWLVLAVVLYTAATLLRAGWRGHSAPQRSEESP